MGDWTPALEAVFKPVRRQTTVQETVKRLGTAVRLGVLAAGSRLPPERELAERLCINRCTLREALTTLVESGHLVSLQGGRGGTFVTDAPPLSVGPGAAPLGEDARALLDLRVAIETGATVLAAERAQTEEVDRLDEAIGQMAAANSFAEYRRADARFHLGVAEGAHSPRLVAAMTEVHNEMSDLIAGMAHRRERLTRSNGQHKGLVELLRRRQSSLAVLLMLEHVEQTEQLLADLSTNVSRPRQETREEAARCSAADR